MVSRARMCIDQTNDREQVDVKAMRISRYQFGRNYMDAYHSCFPISAPEEDLDARLALYSLRRYVFLKCVELFGSALSNESLALSGLTDPYVSVIFTKAPSSHQTRKFDKSTSSYP